MRIVRLLRSGLKFAAVALAVAGGAVFVTVLVSSGQTVSSIRFRVTQVIDQFVIDLDGSTPEDTPRFNLIALDDLDDDDNVDLVSVDTDLDEINLHFGDGSGMLAAPVSFGAVDSDDATFSPIAVVIGDFTAPFDENGGAPDGDLDLALVDDFGDVAIMIGDGTGEFLTPDQNIELEPSDDVSGAVAGDFDGDGDLDLALAATSEVAFACNSGGTFAPCPRPFVVLSDNAATDIVDLAVGDFDNDGRSDVVALVTATGLAYPIFGIGNGQFEVGFAVGVAIEGADPVASVAVADFDADGVDDFVAVTTNFQDGGQVSLGAANRRFRSIPFSVPDDTTATIAGSFGEDDLADILFSASPQLLFVAGDGTGDFSGGFGADGATERGVNNRLLGDAQVLKAADLNNDGLLDIVGLVADGAEIDVALNVVRQPTVTPEPVSPTPAPTTAGPTATNTPPPATVTPTTIPTAGLGRCDYQVSAITDPAALRGVAVGDLNGVGGPDIAVSDGTFVHIIGNSEGFPSNTLRQCAIDQLGGAAPAAPSDVTMARVAGAGDLALLDLGEDASLDPEIAVIGDAGVSFLRRGGDGIFTVDASLTVPITGRAVQIVTDYASNPIDQRRRAPLDFDGDGNTDVLVANLNSLDVSILYGNAGLDPFDPVTVRVGAPSKSVSAGDVNGDGRIDFVVAASNGRIIYILQRAGSGARPEFSIGGTFDAGAAVEALQTGFFNDDARADVLYADGEPSTRVLVTNATNLSSPTRFLAFLLDDQPSAVATLLFDPIDARLDAVVAVPAEDELAFGLGSGDGSIGQVLQPLATGPQPRDLAAADIDQDTQLDVVTANGDGSVSILISSQPPPTPTPTVTLTPTVTPTFTITNTPTVTPTVTATPDGSATPTVPTATPTNTKAGIFELSGGGCAVDESGSANFPVALVLIFGVMLAARASARGRRH